MRKRTFARECVLKILYQIEIMNDNPRDILTSFWEDNPEEKDVRVFANRIVEGVVEKLDELDAMIAKHTQNWDMRRMAILDKNILRFGTYELLYMDDVPPKVTINEAVNIAKKYSQEDSGKFVNGVLDHINHSEVAEKGITES